MKNEAVREQSIKKSRFREKRYQSRIARNGVQRYFLTMLIFIPVCLLTMGLLYLTAVAVYYVFHLNKYIITYNLAHTLLDWAQVLAAIPLIIGWGIITRRSLAKPLQYLDEVVTASAQIAQHTGAPVVLSEELKEVQDDLNTIRENALRSEAISKEAEQRKNDLVVYLAHDLKTPLASVIGYLNLLRDEPQISDELREKYLSITIDKANRLEDLINEFFEIARFNLSDIPLQYGRINLTRLLEQLVFEFKPMLEEKHLRCTLNISPNMMIRCDADQISRAFDNLLRNAVIYSYENTDIIISAVVNGQNILIRFVNHGDTIPKEKLERIFEQFYRVDASRNSGVGGAGLGLAIARQIIEKHHGEICARSENEQIEFEMILPVEADSGVLLPGNAFE